MLATADNTRLRMMLEPGEGGGLKINARNKIIIIVVVVVVVIIIIILLLFYYYYYLFYFVCTLGSKDPEG